MTASQLIARLTELAAEYGDIEVRAEMATEGDIVAVEYGDLADGEGRLYLLD